MTTFIFGEAMLEFHSRGTGGFRYGGDTLNTAIHLARAGHPVAYVTALGTDPVSDALVAAWQAEGIDTRHVLRHPSRQPGIYAIHLDPDGERSFLYWRETSAARAMFDLPGMVAALTEAGGAKLVYFSLITLAIIGAAGRERLLSLAEERWASGLAVAYDSNFRPQLWANLEEARTVSGRAMRACTIGLPTDSDEAQIWGGPDHADALLGRWREAGVPLVALKAGAQGCVCFEDAGPPHRYSAKQVAVVDTSGAGDAFNGGFLGALLAGQPTGAAVDAGQALATATLGHKGAIRLG